MKENTPPLTCCFTGHRHIPQQEQADIQLRLREIIIQLIREGVCHFAAGGALGFDTLAALTVLELKAEYPDIKLILLLPCKDQSSRWNLSDVTVYRSILARADKLLWEAEQYTQGCMQARNRHLVDSAAMCVCYLKKTKGGTAYTVNYARRRGLSVYNIAEPEDGQLTFL